MSRWSDGQSWRYGGGAVRQTECGQTDGEKEKVVYKVADSRLKRMKGSGKETMKKKERQTDRHRQRQTDRVRVSNRENEKERICRATKRNKLAIMSNIVSFNEKGDLGFFLETLKFMVFERG